MNKESVAMLLSKNSILPPNEWQHDPNIQNN